MKKALLACAVSMALLNVVGCSDQNTDTLNKDALAEAQNASAQFEVNFPAPEAQASLISDDAQSIKLRMVSMASLISALERCKEVGGWPNYCLGELDEIIDEAQAARESYDLFPESEYLQGIISKYTSLSSEELESKNTIYFSRQLAEITKALLDAGALETLDFGNTLIERDLTRASNSATISNLLTGLYLVVAEQQDAQGERIAYEIMSAYLGEGENPITLNMMSGSWQVVNSSNQASPINFSLLSSTLSAEWDWDLTTEGNQNVIEAASGGDTASAALAAIHYWNHGQSASFRDIMPSNAGIFDPVNFIFDLRLDDNSIDSIRAYSDLYGDYPQAQNNSENDVHSEMEGFFHQMYDARLSGAKSIQAGMFSFDIEQYDQESKSSDNQEAGAYILDDAIPSLITNNDGNGNRLYEMDDYNEGYNRYDGEYSYRDISGQMQTLYYVSKFNAETIWKSPNTHTDLSTLANMTVSGGNQVDGYLVEFISKGTGHETSGTSESILSANTPESHSLMALAMSQIQQKNGLGASAASHPLGNQCASIEETFIQHNATYAWVDDQWQAGIFNWTYEVNQTGSGWEISGSDMNGDGLVEPFETGVILNQGTAVEFCQNCENIPVYNLITHREEGGNTLSWTMAYAYISDDELAQDWTEVLDETQTPIPYQYEKDGVTITLSYQQYRVSDLDDDGVVEYFENVGGKTTNEYYDIHVCYQPIRLSGGAQDKALDDFLYEPEDPTVQVEVTVTTTAYTQGELRTADGGVQMQCDLDQNKQVGDTETYSEVWTRSGDTITAYEVEDSQDQWTMPINLSTATIAIDDTYVDEDPTGVYGDIYSLTEDSTGSLVWNAETSAFEGSGIREVSTLSWNINGETSICDETIDVSAVITSGSASKFLGNE